MRILLVFTHPSEESLSHRLFVAAQETLEAAGHEVRSRDLYREGFDPVLTKTEWHQYFDAPAPLLEKQAQSVDDLRWAEGLVFVHPTWYFGLPALLKGWFERTWLPGVTFEKADGKGKLTKPLLSNIKLLCVITSSGSPWWFFRLTGDPQRSFFTKAMRPAFNLRCKVKWLQLYDMNCVTQTDRDNFVSKVKNYLSRL